jgi:hypothetical protein
MLAGCFLYDGKPVETVAAAIAGFALISMGFAH